MRRLAVSEWRWADLALVLFCALTAFASPVVADEAGEGARERGGRVPDLELDLDLDASEGVGAISGTRTRTGRAMLLEGRLRAVPELTYGILRVQLDADFRHRTTLFPSDELIDVPQYRGDGSLDVRLRPSRRLRFHFGADLRGVLRPNWADQYQPRLDGTLIPTDRYSYWSRGLHGDIKGIPIDHHHARIGYRYVLVDYEHDPNFDPINRPNHLVPRSHEEHEVRAAWHLVDDGLRLGGSIESFYRSYFWAFARDAGTGLTHASPGGENPNPLERLWGVTPALDVEIPLLDGKLTLDLEYAHDVVIDVFEGYRSQHAPKPSVRLDAAPTEKLDLSVSASFRHRHYFDGGYAVSANHPPLDYRDERLDTRVKAGFRLEQTVARGLRLFLTYDFVWRRTNFPDYVPLVFPATRTYDIDWDYVNHEILAGLRYRL